MEKHPNKPVLGEVVRFYIADSLFIEACVVRVHAWDHIDIRTDEGEYFLNVRRVTRDHFIGDDEESNAGKWARLARTKL